MPCGLTIDGRRYSGFVLDISQEGLYVQTSARPALGAVVDIELSLPTGKEPLQMRAKVARQRLVPPELRSVAQGGIGVCMDEPPEAYQEYYLSITPLARRRRAVAKPNGPPEAADEPPRDSEDPSLRYRVRVKQEKGSRSRVITVACGTEEEARERALAKAGEGWKVLSADPV
jgi:hypothetical protein